VFGGKTRSLPIGSPKGLHSKGRSSIVLKYLTRVEVTVTNTLAYCGTVLITTVKKFLLHWPKKSNFPFKLVENWSIFSIHSIQKMAHRLLVESHLADRHLIDTVKRRRVTLAIIVSTNVSAIISVDNFGHACCRPNVYCPNGSCLLPAKCLSVKGKGHACCLPNVCI
jgi:hypothetical protein